jgi:hypothetical protein
MRGTVHDNTITNGDGSRMRADLRATAAELNEFLDRFQGKSPQEAVGLVSQSGLIQAMTLAVIGTALVIAIFTVGPFLLTSKPVAAAKAETSETAEAKPSEPAPADTTTPAVAAKGVKPKAAADSVTKDPVLEKLGMSETKTAPAKVNPLDKGVDDLLNDLK